MNGDKPRSAHPLRMMAADYDQASRDPNFGPTSSSSNTGFNSHQHRGARADHHAHRGKGKGHFHKPSAQSGRVEDFLLPEMYRDPWLELYGRLSPAVRLRETVHLREEEHAIVDRNIVDQQPTKRTFTQL